MKNIALTLILAFLIALSAFFSGAETGVYRISRLRIRVGMEEGKKLYKILNKLFMNSQELIFSILIGNNLANFFASSIATALLISWLKKPDQAEYYTTIILTPVLFVFGEVIPKNLFYFRSEKLLSKLSPILWFFYKMFSVIGLNKTLKFISDRSEKLFRISKFEGQTSNEIVKRHIEGILQDTKDEGYLSYIQKDIVKRVMNIFHVSITSVMVPFDRVDMVDVDISKAEFEQMFKKSPYTRILVYENKRQNIIGYVNAYQAICLEEEFELRKILNRIYRFTPNTAVIKALNKMHHKDLKMALIAKPRRDKHYIPLGIVTIKDLAEEITGELTVC